MAKRSIDTKQWADPWYQGLEPIEKLLWMYLFTNCDHAGGWKVNYALAEFQIGGKIDWVKASISLNREKERVIISDKLWFVLDFVSFQYGNIESSDHSFHKAVLRLRDNHINMLNTLSDTLSDTLCNRLNKNKEELNNKKDSKKGDARGKQFEVPTVGDIDAYCKERKNSVDPQAFFDHYEARDWKPKGYTTKMKDWRAAVRTWEKNNFDKGVSSGTSQRNTRPVLEFERNIGTKYDGL